jgi:anti-sigma factor RsiW
MLPEELEFRLTQFLDGTLPPEQRLEIERILAQDPAARQKLEEYRRLDSVVRDAMPVPMIDWDRLATKISSAVDHRRIGAGVFRLPRFWIPAAGALAASVALAFAIASYLRPAETVQPQSFALVTGPQAQAPAGSAVADVRLSLTPPPDSIQYLDVQGVVVQASHVSISGSAQQ